MRQAIPVSRLGRAAGNRQVRRRLACGVALAALMALARPGCAQPDGGVSNNVIQVGGGVADDGLNNISLTAADAKISVTADSTIINWKSFNLAHDERLAFDRASGGAPFKILNLVTGGGASDLAGVIDGAGKGNIWIVNENGINFSGRVQNVTGFVLSTLGITNFDAPDRVYSFSGLKTNALNFSGSIAAAGPVLLLAPAMNSTGTITTGGDAGFVVAQAATVALNDASILQIHIDAGTKVNQSQLAVGGDVTADRIYAFAASDSAIKDILLNVAGNLTANHAVATADGILLSSTGGVVVSGDVASNGDYSVTGGKVELGAAGQATSQSAAGQISVEAKTGNIDAKGAMTLAANTDNSETEGITLKAAASITRDTRFDLRTGQDAGSGISGDLSVRGGAGVVAPPVPRRGTKFVRGGGRNTTAVFSATVTLDQLIVGGQTGDGASTASAGRVLVSAARDDATVTGDVTIAGDVASASDYIVSGKIVTLGQDGASRAQKAGGNIDVTSYAGSIGSAGNLALRSASGSIVLDSSNDIDAHGDLDVQAASGDVRLLSDAVTTPGRLSIAAGSASVAEVIGNVNAGGAFTASGGTVALGATGIITAQIAGGQIAIESKTGNIDAKGSLSLTAQNQLSPAAQALTLTSAGSITSDAALDLAANGGIQANAAQNAVIHSASATKGGVTVAARDGSASVGSVTAAAGVSIGAGQNASTGAVSSGGDLSLTANRGDAVLGTGNAQGQVTVAASQKAAVTGSITAGGDYRVTGGSVELGSQGARTVQSALGGIAIASTATDIVTHGNLGLFANSDGIGNDGLALQANRSIMRADGLFAAHAGWNGAGAGAGGAAASDASIHAGQDATLDMVTAAQDIVAGGGGTLAIGQAVAGRNIEAAAANVSLGADARGGHVLATAGADLALDANAADFVLAGAGGNAAIGTAAAGSFVRVAAGGAARIAGPVTAGGDYAATGGAVELGAAGQAVSQKSGGQITITSTAGNIDAKGNLALTALNGPLALSAVGSITRDTGFAVFAGGTSDVSVTAGGAAGLAATAGRDIDVGTGGAASVEAVAANDVRIRSGGNAAVTASAGGNVAVAAGGDANVAANAGGSVTVSGQHDANVSSAVAGAGDVSVTAATGNAVLAGGAQAGGNVMIAAAGAVSVTGDVVAARNYSIAGQTVALGGAGAMQKAGGNISIDAADMDLAAILQAGNRLNLTISGNADALIGGSAAPAAGFHLDNGELGRIEVPEIQIDARDSLVRIAAADIPAATHNFALATRGDIVVTGPVQGSGSLILGAGLDGAGAASSIQIVSEAGAQGRLAADTLILRAEKIVAGSRDFIAETLGKTIPDIVGHYLGQTGSRLYNPRSPDPAYPAILKANSRLQLAVGQWALVQNTGPASDPGGGVDARSLQFADLTPDGQSPAIGLFGKINGQAGPTAALVMTFDQLGGIQPNNIRINGCVVLSVNCVLANVNVPNITLVDPARVVLRTNLPSLAVPVNLMAGMSNEALWNGDGLEDIAPAAGYTADEDKEVKP